MELNKRHNLVIRKGVIIIPSALNLFYKNDIAKTECLLDPASSYALIFFKHLHPYYQELL